VWVNLVYSVDGRLSCFYLLAIAYYTAVNIRIQVCVDISSFFPRICLGGELLGGMVTVSEVLQHYFLNPLCPVLFPVAVHEGSGFCTPLSTLLLSDFFIVASLGRVKSHLI
jgi:hypothetical protein